MISRRLRRLRLPLERLTASTVLTFWILLNHFILRHLDISAGMVYTGLGSGLAVSTFGSVT